MFDSAVAATILGLTWFQRKNQVLGLSTLSTKSARTGSYSCGGNDFERVRFGFKASLSLFGP